MSGFVPGAEGILDTGKHWSAARITAAGSFDPPWLSTLRLGLPLRVLLLLGGGCARGCMVCLLLDSCCGCLLTSALLWLLWTAGYACWLSSCCWVSGKPWSVS